MWCMYVCSSSVFFSAVFPTSYSSCMQVFTHKWHGLWLDFMETQCIFLQYLDVVGYLPFGWLNSTKQ